MFVHLFVFSAVGALAFLCLWEFRRYRLAADDPSGFPYPRARLVRRELTSLLGIAILIGLVYRPSGLSPSGDLAWYGVCLLLTFLVLYLAVRDLREASAAAIELRRRFQEHTAEQLEELFEESRSARDRRKRRR